MKNHSRLQGKVAIITGASSGIGRAIAQVFAQEGAKVVCANLGHPGAERVVLEIKKKGGEAIFVKTDVSKEEEVKNMVETTIKKYGRLDILVNNAGILKWGDCCSISEKDWNEVLAVNLKGVYLGIKYAIPKMKKGGSIINITSISGLIGIQNVAAYGTSKGGIIALTRDAAIDYAPQGIRVNAIAPGLIKTAMTKEILADPEMTKRLIECTPLKRIGKPKEVAYGALYLASEESSFMTGQVLVIDGGRTAQ